MCIFYKLVIKYFYLYYFILKHNCFEFFVQGQNLNFIATNLVKFCLQVNKNFELCS